MFGGRQAKKIFKFFSKIEFPIQCTWFEGYKLNSCGVMSFQSIQGTKSCQGVGPTPLLLKGLNCVGAVDS